jgi:Zn-dependent peptidase ImmA (M78 family)
LTPAFARTLAKTFRHELQLGDHPAASLLSVLQEIHGVKVFHLPFSPLGSAACTVSETFGAAVLLNKGNVRWRRNFDLAHEIFHILTWSAYAAATGQAECALHETLANIFASNLLIPLDALETSVTRAAADGKLRIRTLFDLAREFDVSVEALLWQFAYLYKQDPSRIKGLVDQCKSRASLYEKREQEDPPEYPDRYVSLALTALHSGEISVGRFAAYLDLSRSEANSFLQEDPLGDEEIEVSST